MSTITKERLQRLIRAIDSGNYDEEEIVGWVNSDEILELARITLASLESEPVCVIDQSNLDYLKSGSDADVWPASRTEMGDVLLYRAAPPAPVSVPDELTREEYKRRFMEDDSFNDTFRGGWNACRDAMIQGADGNSPDGWVACSERMPEDEQEVITHNIFGYRHVSFFDEHSGHFFDRLDGSQVDCVEHVLVSHWMPLPAAPQQEVKP